MNKKGFTLVELMVVIVIIGVLAAVAIPKMMAATNKAKASEGPQMIGSIANLEHAFNAEYGAYALAPSETVASPVADAWSAIGMDQNPISKYFEFEVASGTGGQAVAVNTDLFPSNVSPFSNFNVFASLKSNLGLATASCYISVDDQDNKYANKELNKLIGSFGATGI